MELLRIHQVDLSAYLVERLHNLHAFVKRHIGALLAASSDAAANFSGFVAQLVAYRRVFATIDRAVGKMMLNDVGRKNIASISTARLGTQWWDGRRPRFQRGRQYGMATTLDRRMIEVCASTPVKAGSLTAVILVGVPSTIDEKDTG